MTSPLEKVNALIDRAISTNFEEEARTSALLAVRLIRSNSLLLVLVQETATERPATPPSAGNWRHLQNRFENYRCPLCWRPIRVGASVIWATGHKSICESCFDDGRVLPVHTRKGG